MNDGAILRGESTERGVIRKEEDLQETPIVFINLYGPERRVIFNKNGIGRESYWKGQLYPDNRPGGTSFRARYGWTRRKNLIDRPSKMKNPDAAAGEMPQQSLFDPVRFN